MVAVNERGGGSCTAVITLDHYNMDKRAFFPAVIDVADSKDARGGAGSISCLGNCSPDFYIIKEHIYTTQVDK